MGHEVLQIALMTKTSTHEDDSAQNHDLALAEMIRELPTVSLEECEADWRTLDKADEADERADHGADRTIDNGGELERYNGDAGRDVKDAKKDKDCNFGIEM